MTSPATSVAGGHLLDHPETASLDGAHSIFAKRIGRVARYHPDVAGFVSCPQAMTDRDWRDLAELVGAGAEFTLRNLALEPPPWFTVVQRLQVVQMTGESLQTRLDPELEELGPQDVSEMLDLVSRTRPGPFRGRTIEMGTYLGLRVDGRIVAMAGERLHPPGWTEISAVCVDPDFRRQGIGARLVASVGALIRARGEVPFLHALATNTSAIDLYEQLGFHLRQRPTVTLLRHTG